MKRFVLITVPVILFLILLDSISLANDLDFSGAFQREGEALARWIPNRIFGLLAIIISEIIVLRILLKMKFFDCVMISILVNFFSTFVGLAASIISCFIPLYHLVIVFLFSTLTYLYKPPKWFWGVSIIVLLLGIHTLFLPFSLDLTPSPLKEDVFFWSLSLMLVGFGKTLLTEGWIINAIFKKRIEKGLSGKLNIWHVVLITNMISYIVIIPFLVEVPPLRASFMN